MNGENKNYKSNDKSARKGSFNVLDIVLIVIVLLCIASIVYRFGLIDKIGVSDNLEDYQIYFKIDNIRSSSKDALSQHEGDTVRFTGSGEKLGTLDKLTSVSPAVAMYGEDGETVQYPADTENPDNTRLEVNGSITVKGIMTEKGFMVNGKTYIAPNVILNISTEHIETSVKVMEITKKAS